MLCLVFLFFFFKYTATPEIYTDCHPLALHDALPISPGSVSAQRPRLPGGHGAGGGARTRRGLSPPGAGSVPRHRDGGQHRRDARRLRSEEHTSELQSLMRISYAVFCLKKKKKQTEIDNNYT